MKKLKCLLWTGNHHQRTFRPERKEVIWSWNKLHKEHCYSLCSSPNTVRLIKLKSIMWAMHVAYMVKLKMHKTFWSENLKGKDHVIAWCRWDNIEMAHKELGCESVYCIQPAHDSIAWILGTLTYLLVPCKAGNVSTHWADRSFLRRVLLHDVSYMNLKSDFIDVLKNGSLHQKLGHSMKYRCH